MIRLMFFIVLLQVFTHVLSDNAKNSHYHDEPKTKDSNGRRSGIIILNHSGKASDGSRITSHKVETKTYTTHVSSGSAGSGGLNEWLSGNQNEGNVVLQPQIQRIVETQQPCELRDGILSNTGGETSVINKKSTIESSKIVNSGSSSSSVDSNTNQWQSAQKGLETESLVVGQVDDFGSSVPQKPSSQITINDENELRERIIADDNQKVNTLEEIDENREKESILYPENETHKVSIISSADGIYANEVTGQQAKNLNLMVASDANSPNIVAVPVMGRLKLGHNIVQGYRPNIQYYLKQTETRNMIRNPSVREPSFIQHIKPDQSFIQLSDDQLNSYKQYLIQSGLIKLKPYQVIFSEQFRPKLKTLQWMAIPLDSNAEFCKQRCGHLYARNALYSTISENVSKLPLKLLVPVLKIRNGFSKTVTGTKTVVDGVGDIGVGMFRMVKDTPSHAAGLLKEKSEESDNKS